MEAEVKKDVWIIPERTIVRNKVYFYEPVTEEEALEKYANDDFEDIMDTYYDYDGEVLDWAE